MHVVFVVVVVVDEVLRHRLPPEVALMGNVESGSEKIDAGIYKGRAGEAR